MRSLRFTLLQPADSKMGAVGEHGMMRGRFAMSCFVCRLPLGGPDLPACVCLRCGEGCCEGCMMTWVATYGKRPCDCPTELSFEIDVPLGIRPNDPWGIRILGMLEPTTLQQLWHGNAPRSFWQCMPEQRMYSPMVVPDGSQRTAVWLDLPEAYTYEWEDSDL